MKITISHIRGILVSNIIILGLTACSSEPAPWTRPDESPWSEKHAAAKAAEEVEVIEEPVIISEPEPMPETVVYEEPVAVVAAPVMVEPEPVELSPEQQILAMGSGYAVQIYASTNMGSMDKFKAQNGLDDMLAVKTDRNGSPMYVLVSPQEDRASANTVAAELEQKTGTKPWVRSIESLQKVIMQ